MFYIVGECFSSAADTHLATHLTCKVSSFTAQSLLWAAALVPSELFWINAAEMFVINYKCPFCMDDTNWKSFCVLDSDQISEKYEVPSERNPCDTLGGIGQFCSSFRGWDCQPEETAVLRRFLAFFWHRFDPPDSYLWVWHGYFTKKSSLALFFRPQWGHEHFGTPLGRVATAYSIDKSK